MCNDRQSKNDNPKKTNGGAAEVNFPRKGELCLSPSVSPFINMYRGCFPLWRKITDWGWYKDSDTKAVFLHLLLITNFKDSNYLGHKILKGQCVTGRKMLSAALGLSERQIRTAIRHLKATNEVTATATSKYTIYTLTNFSKYIPLFDKKKEKATNEKPLKRPASDQQATTSNNVNNDNNNKKREAPPPLDTVIKYFEEIKHPLQANLFFDYFQSNGWKVGGKTPMKDWKAAARNWCRRDFDGKKDKQTIKYY